MIKELIINGEVHAIYEVEKTKLFICIREHFKPRNLNYLEVEDLLTKIIQFIENKKFKFIGFLNIEKK